LLLPLIGVAASLVVCWSVVAGDYASVVSFSDRAYTVGWNGDEPPAPPFTVHTSTEQGHNWPQLARIGLFDERERLSAADQPIPSEKELSDVTTLGLMGGDDRSGDCRLSDDDCVLTCCESCCCVLWTAWADALWLSRSSPDSNDLVMDDEAGPTPTNPARLNAEDLDFDYAPGFRLGLLHYLSDCHSIGIGYFGVDGWNDSATVFPPPSPLFVQYPGAGVPIPGAVTFSNGTDLYSAEINFRRHVTSWLAFVAGFRWVELNDYLLTSSSVLGPLYSIDTNNHLYGPQLGLDAIFWDEGGRLRVDGWLKAGVMYNRADQRTNEFIFGPATVADSDDHTAFLGDLGISALIRLTGSLGFRLGYQFLWLEGVALAPDQIAPTDITVPVTVLDTSGGPYFNGGFVGLELSW
jgi:hypothetical protein